MWKVFEGFTPMMLSGLLACKQALPGEHYIITWLEISQSAFHIPFWDTDIQIYETQVQALLPLFPTPPSYPQQPQESLPAG